MRATSLRVLLLAAALLAARAPAAAAETHTLRFATIAPEGTAWARELRAFARDVETATNGKVRVKMYFGAIAGDEAQMHARIRRGQLDGAASGGAICEKLAPSMRVMRVVGLMRDYAETSFVTSRLLPTFEAEYKKSGFVHLGTTALGPHILFTREPVTQLTDLGRGRYWVWLHDDVLRQEMPLLGVSLAPMELEDGARAYEQGRIDGFLAPPQVALAFQWSAHAKFLAELPIDSLSGCLVIAERAFDPLPDDARQAVRSAGAKLAVRFADLGVKTDAALLGGLFAKQGVKTVKVSETFRAEFFARARNIREQLGDTLVPTPLLNRVLTLLADYRAEHGGQ
ncbi:MAG TPA: TRAP transporter substrate-binding protein DctP [Kofleriaceae bacterium]|nr:TRAP transporter substrate-binding protein DctP [Kofleriaceae bacterium]